METETIESKGVSNVGNLQKSKENLDSLRKLERIIFRNPVADIPQGMSLYAISGKRTVTEIEKTEIQTQYTILKGYFCQLQKSNVILSWREEKFMMRIKMALLAAESVTGRIPLVE